MVFDDRVMTELKLHQFADLILTLAKRCQGATAEQGLYNGNLGANRLGRQ